MPKCGKPDCQFQAVEEKSKCFLHLEYEKLTRAIRRTSDEKEKEVLKDQRDVVNSQLRKRKQPDPPSSSSSACSSSSSSLSTCMGTRVETSQSESVTRRERVSHSETNIERERRPDGTVSERETTRTESRVIEVEIKRVFTQSWEQYQTRKVAEAHSWTATIRTPEGWSSFAKEIENRYPTKAKRWTGGVFKWAEEPIDQCMEKHKKSMQGLVDSLAAQKPDEMTVWTKAEWIKIAAKEMEPLYPTAAYAFRVIGNVFEGAGQVKAEDIQNQAIYEQHRQNRTLLTMECYVPTLSKDPSIMSL
jgi:hypothetical protein